MRQSGGSPRAAAACAWLHCMGRMTQEQRQALQSYRSATEFPGQGPPIRDPTCRPAAPDAMKASAGRGAARTPCRCKGCGDYPAYS